MSAPAGCAVTPGVSEASAVPLATLHAPALLVPDEWFEPRSPGVVAAVDAPEVVETMPVQLRLAPFGAAHEPCDRNQHDHHDQREDHQPHLGMLRRAMLRPLPPDAPHVNDPAVVASVVATFEQYERALLANDLDALDAFMWRDPRLVRIGVDERQDGFDAVTAYRRTQVRQTAPRVLRDTAVVTFDDHMAVVTTAFVPTDGSPTGRQSQTWVRMADGWRIVAAHVSLPASGSVQGLDSKP